MTTPAEATRQRLKDQVKMLEATECILGHLDGCPPTSVILVTPDLGILIPDDHDTVYEVVNRLTDQMPGITILFMRWAEPHFVAFSLKEEFYAALPPS